MNETLFSWVLVGLYALVIVGIAWRSSRRTKSVETYSVGTRRVSPIAVGLSLAASLTSAATFVINPGLIYLYGWAGVLGYAVAAPLGIFIGLTVFSKSFRKVGDKTNVLTVPQWVGDRFGDRRLTVYFAFLSLLQITFLILIVVGLTVVLERALAIPTWVSLGMVVGFTFTYILLGGASTHILTNSVQAGIMIVVAFIFLGSGFEFYREGVGGFFERLSTVAPHYDAATNPDSLLFRDFFEVMVANFVVGVAIILQPHVISKALYLRTEADVNKYLVTAAVVATLFFAVLITGLFARLALEGPVLPPDVVMATYMVEAFGPFVRAIVVLGLLAAGFSTMEGILVALSSIFANDFMKNVLPSARRAGDAWRPRSLRWARGFLIVLAPVTIWLSWQQIHDPSLSVAIFAQNGVYGLFAATFVPILFGIFFDGADRRWVFAASLTALVVHFGMYYGEITMYHNNPAVPATFAILASLLVMGVGTVATGRRVRLASEAPVVDAGEARPVGGGRRS
jgi:sodium/pantothenate symporter